MAQEVNLLPIYTAVVGGFIAIGGGFVTHYLTSGREKTKLLIEKLEEAYLHIDNLGTWVGEQQSMLIGYSPNTHTEDPLSKIILYLQVYLKNCDKLIESLEKSHSDVLNVIFDVAKNPESNKERSPDFAQKRDDLMKYSDQAQAAIRKKISTLL